MSSIQQREKHLNKFAFDTGKWISLILDKKEEIRFKLEVKTFDDRQDTGNQRLIIMTLSKENQKRKNRLLPKHPENIFLFELAAIYDIEATLSKTALDECFKNEMPALYEQFSGIIEEILSVSGIDFIDLPEYSQLIF